MKVMHKFSTDEKICDYLFEYVNFSYLCIYDCTF